MVISENIALSYWNISLHLDILDICTKLPKNPSNGFQDIPSKTQKCQPQGGAGGNSVVLQSQNVIHPLGTMNV